MKRKKISLNEIMGSGGEVAEKEGIDLDDLGELLGDRMPKLEFHPVGRLRLITALRNRFGDNWKALPGMTELMKKFDDEADFSVRIEELKMLGKGRG